MKERLVLEIRPATGGEEASLFALELLRMYQRFAEKSGFDFSLLEIDKTPLHGLKLAVAEIFGQSAWQTLRFESGIHRVQRVPKTEKSGRIHTSAVSVVVLPEPEEQESTLSPADLKFEFFRARGAGGQNVNKVETAVRVRHLKTGLSATAQEERSQQQNRARALRVLKARLAELQRQQQTQKQATLRRAAWRTGDRSEKIRTYDFPDDRLVDHRVKKSWSNLKKILDGNLWGVTQALRSRLI